MKRVFMQFWMPLALAALPLTSLAQTLPFDPNASAPATLSMAPTFEVGGRTSFDLIRLDAERLSFPLRYGNLRQGSETVELDGRVLRKGRDYSIDYTAGTVYLLTPYRVGQSLRVQYRYDPATGETGLFGVSKDPVMGFGLNFAPGSKLLIGMGMTERLGDGTVLSSNLYGLQNNFSFGGGGKVTGLFVVGERQRAQTTNLMNGAEGNDDVEQGKSTAIVQKLETNFLGGKLEANFQDIGSDFAGFQSFASAGVDDKLIQSYQKERGLKRSSFGLQNLGFGPMQFSSNQRTVGDAKGAINWRSYGLVAGGLKLDWSSQKVDRGFTRFNDLREDDAKQLSKERGLLRQNLVGEYKSGKIEAKYDALNVENEDGASIDRRSINFAAPWATFNFSDQKVDESFSRFGDLREEDRGQLAREQGLTRRSFGFGTSVLGGPLNYQVQRVRQDEGGLERVDFGYKTKRFSVDYLSRSSDADFSALGNLRPDEINSDTQAALNMIDPGLKPRGDDAGFYRNGAGLDRSLWRISYDASANAKIRLDQYGLGGVKDDASMRTIQFDSPKYKFLSRTMKFGEEFESDFGRLLPSERQFFGTIPGLSRSDLQATADLGKGFKFAIDRLAAQTAEGDLNRLGVDYSQPGLEFNYIRRDVDSGFGPISGLAHPERDLLAALSGYDQTQTSLRWQVFRNLGLDVFRSDAINSDEKDARRVHKTAAIWGLDAKTTIQMLESNESTTDAGVTVRDEKYGKVAVTHDFGKLGSLQLIQETRDYAGTQDGSPDARRETVVYDVDLNSKTKLRTEQSRMKTETGERETKSSNTIATQITPRVGVSLTDTQIKRDGDAPNETNRNYGFWLDFGKGIRLNYSYLRELQGDDSGTLNSQFSVTPGEVGGLKIESASYERKMWDGRNDQHTGNVRLGTVKPLQLGILKDLQFQYVADTARDHYVFRKENRHSWLSGNMYGLGFRYDYVSQINPNGDRAIDRGFRFTTDQSESRAFRADVEYKVRTLPWDESVMIRRYNLVAKPGPNWLISHTIETNPEQARNDALLGSLAQDVRRNSWKIDFIGDKHTKGGFEWGETLTDKNDSMMRQGKVNLELFADNPSPLKLSYGVNQWERNGERQTQHGFSLQYDQRPGPNQSFSIFLSNLNYQHSRPSNARLQNWNMRLEYSLRF